MSSTIDESLDYWDYLATILDNNGCPEEPAASQQTHQQPPQVAERSNVAGATNQACDCSHSISGCDRSNQGQFQHDQQGAATTYIMPIADATQAVNQPTVATNNNAFNNSFSEYSWSGSENTATTSSTAARGSSPFVTTTTTTSLNAGTTPANQNANFPQTIMAAPTGAAAAATAAASGGCAIMMNNPYAAMGGGAMQQAQQQQQALSGSALPLPSSVNMAGISTVLPTAFQQQVSALPNSTWEQILALSLQQAMLQQTPQSPPPSQQQTPPQQQQQQQPWPNSLQQQHQPQSHHYLQMLQEQTNQCNSCSYPPNTNANTYPLPSLPLIHQPQVNQQPLSAQAPPCTFVNNSMTTTTTNTTTTPCQGGTVNTNCSNATPGSNLEPIPFAQQQQPSLPLHLSQQQQQPLLQQQQTLTSSFEPISCLDDPACCQPTSIFGNTNQGILPMSSFEMAATGAGAAMVHSPRLDPMLGGSGSAAAPAGSGSSTPSLTGVVKIESSLLAKAIACGPHTFTAHPQAKRKGFSNNGPCSIIKPMTAYNYFFRDERYNIVNWTGDGLPAPVTDWSAERQRAMLCEHWFVDPVKGRRLHRKTEGKLGFNDLSAVIAQRWKDLPDDGRAFYKSLALLDNQRYHKAMMKENCSGNQPQCFAPGTALSPSLSPTTAALLTYASPSSR